MIFDEDIDEVFVSLANSTKSLLITIGHFVHVLLQAARYLLSPMVVPRLHSDFFTPCFMTTQFAKFLSKRGEMAHALVLLPDVHQKNGWTLTWRGFARAGMPIVLVVLVSWRLYGVRMRFFEN